MQIEYIKQISTKQRGFWQPELSLNKDGTVTLKPCTFYFHDMEIEISEETWTPEEGDRVYIENDADPLHLIRQDSEDEYMPLGEDKMSSPGFMIWVEQGIIYVLTHEEETDDEDIETISGSIS